MAKLTTILRFDDGTVEGQILHEGDRESCEELRRMMPAISYGGPKAVKDASMAIWDDCDMPVGQLWRWSEEEPPR